MVIICLGLMVSGAFLLRAYLDVQIMQADLEDLEETRLQQRVELLDTARSFLALKDDYSRIDDFNHKLLVMANLDGFESEESYGGGTPLFSRSTLSPYNSRWLIKGMQGALNELDLQVLDIEGMQQVILKRVRDSKQELDSTPSVWPVRGRITSRFGMRNHPFDRTTKFHRGIDIVPPTGRGALVRASANGVVIFADRDGYYGKCLKIRHFGGVVTRYAHLQSMKVKVGDRVHRDDVIATVGSTGRSTGPHLHYEVIVEGKPRNPRLFILN